MKSILLILSASFCNAELQSEFGTAIPSCMVPVGPVRLLDHQLKQAFSTIEGLEQVFVGVPKKDFRPDKAPKHERLTYVPVETEGRTKEYTYSELLVAANNWIRDIGTGAVFDASDEEWLVWVLNGDTLIRGYPDVVNAALVVDESSAFEWNKEQLSRDLVDKEIYCGAFCFSVTPRVLHEDNYVYDYEMTIKRLPVHKMDRINWLDFGHMATYYRSKRSIFSSRSFNEIKVKHGLILKSGKFDKIKAEYNWYTHLPDTVAIYTPRVVYDVSSRSSYFVEYLPYPTLAEIYVFGNKPPEFWSRMLKKMWDFMRACRIDHSDGVWREGIADPLMLNKTLERCKSLKYPHRQRVADLVEYLKTKEDPKSSIIHGDLCFSNILYDTRSDRIKVIDPRGLDSEGKMTIFGSPLYELAKLYHSAYAMYDFKVANMAVHQEDAWCAKTMQRDILAFAFSEFGFDHKTVTAMTATLFYSMLPLHTDDQARVLRLLETAEWLYNEFKELSEWKS